MFIPNTISSETMNMKIYNREMEFQRNQLGIDSKSLESKAQLIDLSTEKLISKIVNDSSADMKFLHYKILSNGFMPEDIAQELNKIPITTMNSPKIAGLFFKSAVVYTS